MERLIYLDNSATTRPCEEAVRAAEYAMREQFGNPSSLYGVGLAAENLVSAARAAIADRLCCREDEIFFTSCGSESNNTAVFGAAQLLRRRGRHIVTTAVEHPSVLEPVKRLEEQGYEVTRIQPDSDGSIPAERFAEAIRPDTVLVSCMYVNNEVGAIYPVAKLKKRITEKQSPALLHIDCVQAFGKLNIDAGLLGADLITLSAHKIHGLKGAGALYVRKGLRLPSLILGGGQEKGLRSGTEAVPAISAFGAAAEALPALSAQYSGVQEIYDYCRAGLGAFENAVINSPENGLPFILNFSFLGYRSETLLHYLEQYGICVSSGSACSRGQGSHVLRAMGLEQARVDSALRLSFSRETKKEEIDALLTALKGALSLKKSGRQRR